MAVKLESGCLSALEVPAACIRSAVPPVQTLCNAVPRVQAALKAISSPLLDVGIDKATGVVWNITGPADMTLHEVWHGS